MTRWQRWATVGRAVLAHVSEDPLLCFGALEDVQANMASTGVDAGRLDFVKGPATFDSFEKLLERTIEFNPTRTVSSLRRGILHNAVQLEDGSAVVDQRRKMPGVGLVVLHDPVAVLAEMGRCAVAVVYPQQEVEV
jgi:hypothetical protein